MPIPADSHDGPLVFEVERFEHVAAGAERVLLRLDGRYGDRPGKRVLDAMLYVDDALAVHRHAPLEDADGDVDSWLWRAAFDVPAAYLTDERTRFALESEPGQLLDLPRPVGLARGPSMPLSARAAHTARRYAAAIAVLVAVAVTPGGMPASARTDLIRVQRADGTVVYLTRDGQVVRTVPPAAPQPAPQPPAPAPEPQPAPEPDPQPAPEPQPGQAPSQQNHVQAGETAAEGKGGDAAPTPKPTAATGGGSQRQHHAGSSHHAPKPQPTAPRTAPSRTLSSPTGSSGTHVQPPRRRSQRPRHDALAGTTPAPPKSAATSLHSMPELLAAPGSDDVKLATLGEIEGSPAPPKRIPTDGLRPIGELDGPAAAGTATEHEPDAARPQVTTRPPVDAPPLLPITPGDSPAATRGAPQHGSGSTRPVTREETPREDHGGSNHGGHGGGHHTGGSKPQPAPAPAPAPPSSGGGSSIPTGGGGGFDSLPGPAGAVPDFVIDRFRVPPFLLSIYQAAGIQYGIRWEVLAAINEIETDYGRNTNISSAGAQGWMQFMPATWRMYGTDANKDHVKDPYNPVDAIFAAARYLKAAGGDEDVRRAIFAYNHAGWYVDSVMLRARLIAGYPADLVSSLTGLTEGRFPVAAHARYTESDQQGDAADGERGIDISAREGAPVVAVNDGVIKDIGRSKERGLYVVLQDVYGNQYTYSNLGSVAQLYPGPKRDAADTSAARLEILGAGDPTPTGPASAGSQRPGEQAHSRRGRRPSRVKPASAAARSRVVAVKERLFAHPQRPGAKHHGGMEQLLDMRNGGGFETYDSYFAKPLGLNSDNATLRRLKKGSRVVGGTVLGRVGAGADGHTPQIHFQIRPAGRGAPTIDPKPILDGWKLLESTAIYRSKGRNALYGDGDYSIGEVMLLPKPLLAKRVLSDPRIQIYPGGRQDIATGQIDRRVLVVLEYLAESGLHPTVSCLRSGHSYMTASGNVSEHSSGNAVDIAAINGVPIVGHQGPGGVTETTVRRLMLLQGTLRPHQIISLLDYGQNTLALSDHDDHIHVGFQPLFGENTKLGEQAASVLKPDQWSNLVHRLGEIQNPTVPTSPSRFAIPDRNSSGGE